MLTSGAVTRVVAFAPLPARKLFTDVGAVAFDTRAFSRHANRAVDAIVVVLTRLRQVDEDKEQEDETFKVHDMFFSMVYLA